MNVLLHGHAPIVWTLAALLLTAPLAPAQDVSEKDASAKKAPAKDAPAAVQKEPGTEKIAGKSAEGGVPYQWQSYPKRVFSKNQALNRMRIFAQNSFWERLEILSSAAVTYDDDDLQKFGHWYRALLAGHAGDADLAMKHLKLALDYGYKNASSMTDDPSLLVLQDRADFQKMVQDLTERLDKEMHDRFETRTATALEAKDIAAKPWKVDVKASDGKALFEPGVPAVAVLTRSDADGFPKLLPVLRAAAAKLDTEPPIVVIFYCYDASDPINRGLAERCAKQLDLPYRWALIGRSEFKSLTEDLVRRGLEVQDALQKKGASLSAVEARVTFYNYSPVTIFFNGEAAPLYAIPAVPAGWQAVFAFRTFQKAVPRPAVPAEPEKPAELQKPAEPRKPAEPEKPADKSGK